MKTVLMYTPVIHKGVLDFARSLDTETVIYLWGESLIEKEPSLRKEVRALDPLVLSSSLSHLIGKSIQIAEVGQLSEIVKKSDLMIFPNDAVSHRLVDNVLLSLGLQDYLFQPVFLRWDSHNSVTGVPVIPDETRLFSSLRFLADLATLESLKSSDWWRHVGAVLFEPHSSIHLSAHNHHIPSDYTPYIDGDPRAAFHKGVNIDIGTAIHAESMLIGSAAKLGMRTGGMSLLTTTFPCPSCARLIATAGISELYYISGYSVVDGERILREGGVKIIQLV